jgi:hypothetical protein
VLLQLVAALELSSTLADEFLIFGFPSQVHHSLMLCPPTVIVEELWAVAAINLVPGLKTYVTNHVSNNAIFLRGFVVTQVAFVGHVVHGVSVSLQLRNVNEIMNHTKGKNVRRLTCL